MSNWKANVQYDPRYLAYEVYLTRPLGAGRREYLVKGGSESVVLEEGQVYQKTLWFARNADKDALQALTDALAEKNIDPPKRPYVEGKLEATERHLEDMRKLALWNN